MRKKQILSLIGTQMKDVFKLEKLKERQMNMTSIKWIDMLELICYNKIKGVLCLQKLEIH